MKSHRAMLFVVLATAALSSVAVAAEAPNWSYGLGLTHHKETYKERDQLGAPVMKENANLTGIKAIAAHRVGTNGRLAITGEFAAGDGSYKGAYQDGEYGDVHVTGISRRLFETTATYTHFAPAWSGAGITAGLGYRHHVDNAQEAPGGYKRVNKRVYAIVGLENTYDTGNWFITPAAAYKHTLHSEHYSDLLGGLTMDQHGNGADLSVAFKQKSGDYPVTLRPFLRTWEIADSNQIDGFYEPRNKTQEVGLDVTWSF
jgi:hypothetical protein